MAPEQWRGRVQGAAADQYALAVMAYEMFAGHLPFESSDAAVLKQAVLDEAPEDIADIAKPVQEAIKRAMSKEPAERFANCTDFAAALGGRKVKAAKTVKKGGFPKWATALIVLALLLAGGIGYYQYERHQQEQVRQAQIAREKAEEERLAKLAAEKAELERQVRLAAEKAEKERLAKLAAEKAERDRQAKLAAEKAERERLAKLKAEQERLTKLTEEQLDSENAALKVDLGNGVKLEMVKVEPGSFTMSKRDGSNYGDEIEHQKTLTKVFYIGKYEVTNEQWRAVMEVSKVPSFKNQGAKYPVENITWHQAMQFCKKMNRYAPNGWKFTLPTETQWEFAARGGNKSRGYKYSGSNDLDAVGWYRSNSGSSTHEVGRKAPNELGLYDMSGNVYEWCLDNWESSSSNTQAEFRPIYRFRRLAPRAPWWQLEQLRQALPFCGSAQRRSGGPVLRPRLTPRSCLSSMSMLAIVCCKTDACWLS